MNQPTIALIGPGRAGSVLVRALHRAGYPIAAVHGRRPEPAQALAKEVGARATRTSAGALDLAELTILAVPDAAVADLARDLAEAQCSSAGKSVVHTSGAQDRTPLTPLKLAGLRTGVFHPLQGFNPSPDAVRNLPGTLFGIDADGALRATLDQLARDLGGEPFDLAGVDRGRYHAAAALLSNFTVTLFYEAEGLMEQAGLHPAIARRGLIALLRGTLHNLNQGEVANALTGPLARGDAATIQRHLEALKMDRDLQRLYRRLAARTIRLAERSGRLTSQQIDALNPTLLEVP